MKTVCTFLITLLLCIGNLFCQDTSSVIFKLNKIPAEGVLLDKGWKWQKGDNPKWSGAEIEDSHWENIDPSKDIFDLPQLPKTGEILWFRLHLKADSSLSGKLALMILQSGASEIYLNGNLIHRFGKIDTIPKNVRAFDPLNSPVSLPGLNGSEQVLAVRYAFQPGVKYSTDFAKENAGLKIIINSTEGAIQVYTRNHVYNDKHNYLKIGVFCILGILFFTLYLFFPARKVNLDFSIYSLLYTIGWYLVAFINNLNQVDSVFYIINLCLVILVISYFFFVKAVYLLFAEKKNWFYWFLTLLAMASIACGVFIYGWGWLIFGTVFSNLVNLSITITAIKATINKKKGAWIIVTGGVCSLVTWIVFTLQNLKVIPELGIDFFAIGMTSPPIAVAIYLGYEFAFISRSLEKKLLEVQALSYEKQEILTSQNETLEKQVAERTAALNESLENLKSTQSQLIQSEKMASLGELTAGIAHEIQNPLNFVNNFSEVNTELIDELEQEADKGNLDEVKAIAKDIKENEQKINHHGKRADAIVKGMLQHSRQTSGTKEPTDINALADEYLRLSYHARLNAGGGQGLRAKDKSFNATLNTSYDSSIGSLSIIPQDIGRVLLNLFNNAFYAITEKQKTAGSDYQPTVSISTKKNGHTIELTVSDNGNGIPSAIKEKIFQPFFTTKPTGQGTGLGLSLSYDIVKAHGGELKVDTKEGEGTEFIILLPFLF
jgi:signal transduction histidine kinase